METKNNLVILQTGYKPELNKQEILQQITALAAQVSLLEDEILLLSKTVNTLCKHLARANRGKSIK